MTGHKTKKYPGDAIERMREVIKDVDMYWSILGEYGPDSDRALEFRSARQHERRFADSAHGLELIWRDLHEQGRQR